ncbi:MAG: glycosyltransferase family 39 protein [Thermodesulfovibrio sp.]|nr:glycosyltransferase family 39 protein [Thermodesulfovibrio sp.]
MFKFLRDKNYKLFFYLIFAILLGVFFSDWLSHELKNIIQRVRPCQTEYFRGIVGCAHSYSFPSTHASNAFTSSTVLIFFLRKLSVSKKIKNILSIYILLIASLISISRVYLGVHWATDILAGAIFGVILGYLIFYTLLKINSLKRAFYFFLFIITIFRIYFILYSPIDLSPDEAHYWEWSRRLDLSYYSKGPMIAYLIAISTGVFGNNPFGVRVLAVVCSFLCSVFLYKIGNKLFNERVGYISGLLFQLIPLFSAFGVIFTIDSPFILFWIISTYLFILAQEGKIRYWLLLGVFIGFGLLTKYTMAFFYLCIFIYLLKKTHSYIDNFKNPMLYLCVVLSIFVFSPVIIWNFQHDWVTLKHTAGQANLYEGVKISLRSFAEFVGSQLLVVTPLIFIAGFYLLFKRNIFQNKHWWFLISFSMPVFIFFLLKSLQGKVQANWAMPAYIPFLLVISYAFERNILKKLIISSVILASIFTFLTYVIPFFNLPANIDPSLRLKGWRQLGIKVSEIKKEMEKSGNVIIFSDRYQVSSELAFYVKGYPTVYCINLGRRMNQYDLWQSINSELKTETKTHGIYVVYGIKNEPAAEVSSAFERCTSETFTAKQKGVKIREYTIFKCYNFKGMILRKPEKY